MGNVERKRVNNGVDFGLISNLTAKKKPVTIEYTTVNDVWTIEATRLKTGFINGKVYSNRVTAPWSGSDAFGVTSGDFTKIPIYVREFVMSMVKLLRTKDIITQNDIKYACGYYG